LKIPSSLQSSSIEINELKESHSFSRNLSIDSLADPWIIDFRLQTLAKEVSSSRIPIANFENMESKISNPEDA
jgi:hypothetical protein